MVRFHPGGLIKETTMTREQLKELIEDLEEIVCTEGEDTGVILLSSDSPSHYNHKFNCYVYDKEYFSDLGAALVNLHKKMKHIEGKLDA